MDNYQIFQLDNGKFVLLETDETSKDVSPDAVKNILPSIKGSLANTKQSFEDAIESAYDAATALIQRLKSMSDRPDEIEVTFGLKASGDVGNLLISKVSTEANYTVTLKWKHDSKK